jgi:hypothetical protein
MTSQLEIGGQLVDRAAHLQRRDGYDRVGRRRRRLRCDSAVGAVVDPGMEIDASPMRLGMHRLRTQPVSCDPPASLEPTAQIDEKVGNATRLGINSQRIALARLVNGHMQCQKMQPRPAIDLEPQEDRIGFCGTSRAAATGERDQQRKRSSRSATTVHSSKIRRLLAAHLLDMLMLDPLMPLWMGA